MEVGSGGRPGAGKERVLFNGQQTGGIVWSITLLIHSIGLNSIS